jgi:maleylacetoacetate isomerase
MPHSITLYDYPKSSAAYRVRIALNIKGINYTKVKVDLLAEEQHSEFYLATNPQGLVPSLVVGDQAITQSLAIIEWLDEAYPNNPLLPSDAIAKAQLRAQAYAIACDTHPLNNLRVLNYLVNDLGHTETDKLAWYQHWIKLTFAALESQMDDSSQQLKPNLLDLVLVPQVFNANRFNMDMTVYPAICQRVTWCNQQAAFQQAHPDHCD